LLENTNLIYALAGDAVQKGNVRETFFANQLKASHKIQYPEKGDFLVNGTHTFEVGGNNKGLKQISDMPEAYIAADGIEYGFGNKIPIWLFGFLY